MPTTETEWLHGKDNAEVCVWTPQYSGLWLPGCPEENRAYKFTPDMGRKNCVHYGRIIKKKDK